MASEHSAAMMSAADAQCVGWPLPAAVVARTESIRSCAAMAYSVADECALVRALGCLPGTAVVLISWSFHRVVFAGIDALSLVTHRLGRGLRVYGLAGRVILAVVPSERFLGIE